MASSGKKKKGKSTKGTTLNLSEFLGNTAPVLPKATKATAPSWADEMADEDDDVPNFSNIDLSALPTAPRASRGPDVDMAKVPDSPPFTAFLGNLPFDCEEEDIYKFFSGNKLTVVNVRLPQDQGRMKGFGYAEFDSRQALLDALSMNEGQLRNRKIRIDLAGTGQGGDDRGGRDGGRRHGDDGGDDRTAGDWRKAPRPPPSDDYDRRDDRDRGYGGGRNERYGDRSGGGFDRGYDRDRGYGDRDGGRRGYGSGYGDRDRDGGGRYGDRDRDRDGGGRFGDRDRNRYSPPRDRFGGGGGGGGYGGRRDDRGYEPRRDDDGPRERPRLNLAPRTKPVEAPPAEKPADRPPADRPPVDRAPAANPFGSAKPVDTMRFEDKSREERMREAHPPQQQQSSSGERPRLHLQKRTKPVENAASEPSKASSIFGAAKPVDTAAREREIEAKLAREREMEMEAEQREKRLSSSTDIREQRSSRTRKDSNHSNEDESRNNRTRKLSSSSSGKGIRTVAPPPCVGRGRRDSALSDPEDAVFEEDPKSPRSPPSSSQPPPKLVPAPAPAENVWAKRKEQQQQKQDPAPSTTKPQTPDQPQPKPAAYVPAPAPAANAWKKGKPDVSAGGHQAPTNHADRPSTENAWAKGRPHVEGGAPRGRGGQGRGGHAPRGGRQKPHKPLPQSVDEMPKIDDLEPEKKDLADSNKFAMLLDDEEGANSD